MHPRRIDISTHVWVWSVLASDSLQHRGWFKGIFFKAIPEGIAEATAEREKPVGLFTPLRRLTTKDIRRGLAEAVDFLQPFGRPPAKCEKSAAAISRF